MNFIDEKTQQFYDGLTERMAKAEEQAEKDRQERRRNDRIRQVGRVVGGLSNLYWTTRGAPSQDRPPAAESTEKTDGSYSERQDRLNDRLMRAHDSITKLRMANAKTESAIGYNERRQENEARRTDAEIEKRQAEAENLNAKGRLAASQSELKEVEAGIRRQEAANLPIKQQQEAEVRKARAQQAWAAAQRQRNSRPPKLTLKQKRKQK